MTRSPGCRALHDARRKAGDGYAAVLRRVFARLLGSLHHCLAHEELYREDLAFPTPRRAVRPVGGGTGSREHV